MSELQTIRSGIIAGLTEWKNRKNSGIVDAEAQALADATILHFTSQIGAVDKAIALAIENDSDLRSKRDLLLSISGVGDTLAGRLSSSRFLTFTARCCGWPATILRCDGS